MPRIVDLLILALVVAVPIMGSQNRQGGRSRRNRVPIIQSFTSSSSVLELCPFAGPCSLTGTKVSLEVKATDPDNDYLTYSYSVTKGEILGSGALVNWELKAALGEQTARVEVTDRRGGKAISVTEVNVKICGACDPPRQLLSVACPASVSEGETALFEATISPVGSGQKFIYLWSHSNGARISEQEAYKLRIKATGLPGDIIRATVRVLGMDPTSGSQSSCESRISKPVQ